MSAKLSSLADFWFSESRPPKLCQVSRTGPKAPAWATPSLLPLGKGVRSRRTPLLRATGWLWGRPKEPDNSFTLLIWMRLAPVGWASGTALMCFPRHHGKIILARTG